MEICGLKFPKENFYKHFYKRKKEGYVKTPEEYISRIKETIKNADKFYLVRQLQDCIDKIIFFYTQTKWLTMVIYKEKRILTCFYLWKADTVEDYFKMMKFLPYLREDYIENNYREVKKDENSKYSRFITTLQARC